MIGKCVRGATREWVEEVATPALFVGGLICALIATVLENSYQRFTGRKAKS